MTAEQFAQNIQAATEMLAKEIARRVVKDGSIFIGTPEWVGGEIERHAAGVLYDWMLGRLKVNE